MIDEANVTPFWPQGVKVRGQVSGVGGYAENVRNIIRGLMDLGIDVQALEDDGHPASIARNPWLPRRRMPLPGRLALQVAVLPGASLRGGRGVSVYSMFEATRLPEHWVRAARVTRASIVPSAHSYGLWLDAGVPDDRIRIVRHGVDTVRFDGSAPPWQAPPFPDGTRFADRRVRMFHSFGIGPRKNTTGLLTAWLRATRPEDDAALLLKAFGEGPAAEAELAREIAAAEQAAGRPLAAAAPIVWHRDTLPDAEMPGLYTACTHYISASRGEGWDLGMTEAGASGLTLIAPAHTGYLAYLDASVATMIPARVVPATVHPDDLGVREYGGLEWYEPDADALAAAIADAVAGRPQATGAQARIRQAYTLRAAAAELLDAMVSLWPEEAMDGR